MTLNEIKPGQTALVQGIQSDGGSLQEGFKIRLEAMGLIADKPVRAGQTHLIFKKKTHKEFEAFEIV